MSKISEIEEEQRVATKVVVEGMRERAVASYQCTCPGSVKETLNDLEYAARELICTRCRKRVRVKFLDVKRNGL